MGPATLAYSSGLPLPTLLSGTSVAVTVGGTTVSCITCFTRRPYSSPILPSNTPVGTGTISVTYNNDASPTAPITVVKNALGLFTRNQQGSGPGVIQDNTNAYNSLTYSFQPAETVTFCGYRIGSHQRQRRHHAAQRQPARRDCHGKYRWADRRGPICRPFRLCG